MRRALAVVAVAAVLATVSGCRRTSVAVAADAKSQPPSPPPPLPEDPVLGAKATAQWREHLAFEERERKLHVRLDTGCS